MATYDVRLVGRSAKLGSVPGVDVAKLLIHVQRVIARAAAVSIRRPARSTGRWELVIENVTRFRLVKLRQGSMIAEIAFPEAATPDGRFDLDTSSLGEIGWTVALQAISDAEHADTDVVWRLAQLADELGIGDRYTAVEFGPARSKAREKTRLDGGVRMHLHAVLAQRQAAPSPAASVAGLLVEADFEKSSAHVRTPTGDLVELTFGEELADSIYEALRQRSEFEGDVKYEPSTKRIRAIALRRVVRTEQLLLGEEAEAFWQDRSAAELIADQGKTPVESFDGLRDETLTDEEFRSFLAAID